MGMALTIGISGSQYSNDFSRYDSTCSVVTVRGAVDNTLLGQTCTVTLNRKDSYGTVATQVVPSISATFSATFDLNSSLMNDVDGINRAVQGDYQVTATLSGGATATESLTVSLVSVNQLRNQWLYGLTTLSSEIILPRIEPQLTPVTFLAMSPSFIKDVYNLVYTPQNGVEPPTLSFAGGPTVFLNPNSGMQQVVLLDQRQQDWAHVIVDTFLLPGTAQVEALIIDQTKLKDTDFIQQVRLATAWVETKLGFFIEPRLVISDKFTTKYPNYERIMDGVSFYDDFNPMNGVFPDISLPFQFPLVVHDLQGWYNRAQVLSVPASWIQLGAYQQGNIELVPTAGQASSLTWQSFPFAFAAMQTRIVPDFWQYSVTAGLRDLHTDRAVIREAIAKKCGIETALFAASAYRAGISSRSTSRDNISISESYTASAMYSTFAHLTIPWETWLKDNMVIIKRKIGGTPVTTFV